MWWKLFLLTLYVVALFLLSRILETVAYYEGGYLASRILDPVSLSVRKLKLLLDQRGVSYAGVVEKQELTELIGNSGEVTDGEMVAASSEEESAPSTNFTGGLHFYEEVEDTKDSVWVVQVTGFGRQPFMAGQDWRQLSRKLGCFGVRTGIFDCQQDIELCERKKWYTSRVILAVPKGFRAKDQVMLKSYAGASRIQPVFDWVNSNLASRVKAINNSEELANHWFSFTGNSEESKLRMVLFSHMTISPMFISVLSVKFTGRVKFGTVNTGTKAGKSVAKKLKMKKLPKYLVITPEGNQTFGENSGEYLNFKSMMMYFRSLHPEVNDLFLLSLILVNVMCLLEVFIGQGSVLKRLGSLLWYIGKLNFLLILLWLPLLGLFQLPYMNQVLGLGLKALRVAGLTWLAGEIRQDWVCYLNNSTFLCLTFLIYAVLVGLVHYLYQSDRPTDSNNNTQSEWWWHFHWDTYMSALFRPMSTITRPMAPQEMDLEVGMEMLIERLAVPNFWLRPMISTDYVQQLPVWNYTGVVIESDVGSDIECTSIQSDGEDCRSDAESVCSVSSDGLRQRPPFMFVCERCRALQNQDEDRGKSDEELEEERLASESACAKFLMDGDYRCMCGQEHGVTNGRGRKTPQSRKERHKAKCARERTSTPSTSSDKAGGEEGEGGGKNGRGNDEQVSLPQNEMPPGMISTTECAICLESYKWGALLCGLPCGHTFHQTCIMGWFMRDNHCCPVCRWPAYKAKPCSLHSHIE